MRPRRASFALHQSGNLSIMLWLAAIIGVLMIASFVLWFTVWAERALALGALPENRVVSDAS